MKQLIWLLSLGLMLPGLQAQKTNGKKVPLYAIKAGTSLTYIWDYDNSEHQEYTWSVNAVWQFTNRLSGGVNLMTIWNKSPFRDSFHSFIGGPFGQFKLTDGRRWDLYGESGIYIGNYCTCDDSFEVPYKRNGLVYWSQGIGTNVRLTPTLSLDLAFINHIILTKVPQKYNFTQYIIGLDFFLLKN